MTSLLVNIKLIMSPCNSQQLGTVSYRFDPSVQ